MSQFDQWLNQLPQEVQTHLASVGLATAELVADSVQPSHIKGADGVIVTKSVDEVFLEAIAEQCGVVKPATAAWAQVRKFYERCYQEVAGGADTAAPEASPIEAKDAQCEEYYELLPDYRRRKLQELDIARRCEVDDTRRPSQRMWGRWERLKRVHREFEPVPPNKVQSEATARCRPAAASLVPAAGGALAWRLPAIDERPADSLLELEDACLVIENLMFLTGWIKDIGALETFHARFWTRVRHTRKPAPGYRAPTVAELTEAFMLFQRQWAKASRDAEQLDAAVLASLPAAADELDGRLALAPRLLSPHPAAYSPGMQLAAQPAAAPGEPASKRPRLSRAERKARAAAKSATAPRPPPATPALADAPTAATAPAKFSKGKGRGGKGDGGKGAAKSEWCNNFVQGACRFGDKCRYRHQ